MLTLKHVESGDTRTRNRITVVPVLFGSAQLFSDPFRVAH